MKEKDDMLIDINGVAEIFNMSIENIRKYKQLGLIKAYKSEGRKDLYDKADIKDRKILIEKHLSERKQLKEIQPIIAQYEKTRQAYLSVPKGLKKVLIIDDQKAMCRILSQILYRYFSEDRLAVFTANDGESAIQIATKLIPDLIICDIVMEDNSISGIDIYNRLKSESALASTKYIFISGAVEFKPDDTCFLEKPISSYLLVKIVGEIVGIAPKSFPVSYEKNEKNLTKGHVS